MMNALEALVDTLNGLFVAKDWAALEAMDSELRTVVSALVADAKCDRKWLEAQLRQLQALYQAAAEGVEEDRQASIRKMISTRKNFQAASSYLSNS